MDIKTIKELADIMRSSQLTALELEEGETRIRLEAAPAQQQNAMQPPVVIPAKQTGPQEASDPGLDFNVAKAVRAPLVGVFYNAPAPDQEPFVQVGSKVKKGDILCIVEAMKLMNEITSEFDGEIVDICANNEDIIEFGQILFKIFQEPVS